MSPLVAVALLSRNIPHRTLNVRPIGKTWMFGVVTHASSY